MSADEAPAATDLDLNAIEVRVVAVRNWPEFPKVYALATEDVPALVAEVRRLRAEVDGLTPIRGVVRGLPPGP